MKHEEVYQKHSCSIIRIQQDNPMTIPVATEMEDEVIVEKPLTIFLNQQEWITL